LEVQNLRVIAMHSEGERRTAELDRQYQYASELRGLLDERDRYANQLRAHISGMQQSHAWRWSAPLRKLVARLRGSSPEAMLPPPPRRRDGLQQHYQLADVRFEPADKPLVSVVIPAYGNLDYTLACLRSVQQAGAGFEFEVLVFEDRSGDPDIGKLAKVPGLRY